jgi:hypothetical protein
MRGGDDDVAEARIGEVVGPGRGVQPQPDPNEGGTSPNRRQPTVEP